MAAAMLPRCCNAVPATVETDGPEKTTYDTDPQNYVAINRIGQ